MGVWFNSKLENVSPLGNVFVNILAIWKHASISIIWKKDVVHYEQLIFSICRRYNCLQVAGSLVQNETIYMHALSLV